MFYQLKYLKSFFLNYKKVLFRAIFYELIYLIKNFEFRSHLVKNKNKRSTDTVPCPYYFLHLIAKFINNKKIKNIIDLGSGLGRTVKFLSVNTDSNIIGYELNKKIFKRSLKLKNKKIKFFNKNILKLDYHKIQPDCFIMIDPFINKQDTITIQKKIIQSRNFNKRRFYLITVNIDRKLLNKGFKNLRSIKTGKKGSINFLMSN